MSLVRNTLATATIAGLLLVGAGASLSGVAQAATPANAHLTAFTVIDTLSTAPVDVTWNAGSLRFTAGPVFMPTRTSTSTLTWVITTLNVRSTADLAAAMAALGASGADGWDRADG